MLRGMPRPKGARRPRAPACTGNLIKLAGTPQSARPHHPQETSRPGHFIPPRAQRFPPQSSTSNIPRRERRSRAALSGLVAGYAIHSPAPPLSFRRSAATEKSWPANVQIGFLVALEMTILLSVSAAVLCESKKRSHRAARAAIAAFYGAMGPEMAGHLRWQAQAAFAGPPGCCGEYHMRLFRSWATLWPLMQ